MTAETMLCIWVDWDRRIASTHPLPGFEQLCFFSEARYRENLRILTDSGFRFLNEVTP